MVVRMPPPLLRLTEVMSSIDPDTPGTRLEPEDPRSSEGRALAHAFNGTESFPSRTYAPRQRPNRDGV